MKTTLIMIVAGVFVIIVLFFILGIMSKTGDAPGLIDGKLSLCPTKPNCVCSEIEPDDEHYIEPVIVSAKHGEVSLDIVKQVIQDMGGIIQSENDNYAAYQFTSEIFGFVDDLEVRHDIKQKLIHIRSASRVGYSDRGVNRNRVEKIRANIKNKLAL